MLKKLIYLASPYTHEDIGTRLYRNQKVCGAVGLLFSKGLMVFSPVAHSHNVALQYNLYVTRSKVGLDWDAWKEFDLLMLSKCDELYVLTLDGWKESTGVQSEIEEAKRLGIPITYINEHGRDILVW